MSELHIKDFSTGLIQNADLEDIPESASTVLQNFRIVNGKLVKTQGVGLKLDATFSVGTGHMTGMLTWHQEDLASPPASGSGFAYVIAYVTSDYKLRLAVWNANSGAWVDIGTGFTGTDLSSTDYYQRKSWNPVVQIDHCLRFIPGKDAKPDGTNYGVECWLGRIDRDFFDKNYEPAAAVYSYDGGIEPPDLTFTISQIQGGVFNERGARIPVTDMADTTVTIVGDHTEAIQPGDYFLVDENAAAGNNGYYLATAVSLVSGNTVIAFDESFKDVSDDTKNDGWVELPSNGEKLYYKFTYVYDGIQESLFSEPVAVTLDVAANLMPRLEWSFTRTGWNKRITAMNVYRCETRGGIYNKVQTVDFLRKTGKVIGGANTGAFTGHSCVYIPDLAGYNFSSASTYKIWLRLKSGTWTNISFTGVNGTGHDTFYQSTRGYYFAGQDIWDAAWRLTNSGTTVLDSGTSGAFSGEQTVILDTDTGELDSAGGIFYLKDGPEAQLAANKGTTSAAATHSTGERTTITTGSVTHKLEPGDLVELFGFTDAAGYNGTWKVVGVPSTTSFVIDAAFSSDLTGYWRAAGSERVILNNFRKAIHVSKGYKVCVYSEGWRMMKPSIGVYYPTLATDTITYRLYDPGLIAGAEHPLAEEVSIRVTGQFAKVISGRLWLANVTLDPGDTDEAHSDWAAYSELYQYDVRPVSNVERFDDEQGGEITGLDGLDKNVAIAKRTSVHLIATKYYPSDPKRWERTHNVNGLGNLAVRGMIGVEGALYVCHSDGIYRLQANNLADSDRTPVERLRISEPIGNIYNAQTLAQKEAMVVTYNEHRREILWTMQYSVDGTDYDKIYGYHIDNGVWREVWSMVTVSAASLDENGYPMIFNGLNSKVHAFSEDDDNTMSSVRIKQIRLDDEWPKIVRYVTVTYKSARPMKLQVFADNNETAALEVTLPAQLEVTPYRVPIKIRARTLQLEVTESFYGFLLAEPETADPTESYLIAELEGGVNPNTEVHKISIYHD